MNPKDLGAKCKRCPFAKHGEPNRPVLGDGPKNPIGVFVGESPGRDEADRGKPFVGATGQELDNAFIAVKLNRAKLFVVNAICCMPPRSKSEVQMRRAADRCRPALLAQLLELSNTEHVFAAGKWAAYALTGETKGMNKRRGFVREFSLEKMVELNREKLAKIIKKPKRKKS